jgi:hypothetical protein
LVSGRTGEETPRAIWWLGAAAFCLFFGLLFLALTVGFAIQPAQDCEVLTETVVECQEVPVATLAFGAAAAFLLAAMAVALAGFFFSGGRQTVEWLREWVRSSWSAARTEFRE